MKLARGFSRQHRIIHFTAIGSASGLRLLPRGFAYVTSYTLTPGQPPPGLDYLPASPHRLTTTRSGHALRTHVAAEALIVVFRALSITGFIMGAILPVPEYQLVVHRLRLSASP